MRTKIGKSSGQFSHHVIHSASHPLLLAAVAAVVLGNAQAGYAANDLYWDANGVVANTGTTAAGTWGTSSFWNDASSGTGGTLQSATSNINDLHFASDINYTGTYTVTVSGAQAANQLIFEEGTVTLSGGTSITLGGGGGVNPGLQHLLGSPATSISTPLILSANNLFLNGATASLSASGSISSSGANNLTLQANNTGGITLSGTSINHQGSITNSGTGAGSVTLSGGIGANVTSITQSSATSLLSLSGNNSNFAGPISASGTGVKIQFSSDASLGSLASTLTINNGAAFVNSGRVVYGPARTLSIGSGGGTLQTDNSAYTIAGNVVAAGNTTIASSNAGIVHLAGDNTFGGDLTFNGWAAVSSEANLGGASKALKTIAFSGMRLSILGNEISSFGSHATTFTGNTGTALDIQRADHTFTLERDIKVSMNSGSDIVLLKSGAGELVITKHQTIDNGGGGTGLMVAVNGGTLKIDAAAGGDLNTRAVNDNNRIGFGGGTLYLLGKGAALTTTQNLGNTNISFGGGSIVVDNNGGSSSTTLNLGTLATFAAGSNLDIRTTNLGSGSAGVTTTSLNDSSGIVGAGRVTYAGEFATNSTNLSGGAIAAYAGATALPGSGAAAGTNYLQSDSGSVTASQTANTLKIATTTTGQSLSIASGEALTLNSGGLLFTGAADYAITGGSIKSNTATASDLIIHQKGTGALTIGSVIANGIGVSTLTKTGDGTVILSSPNTYTGATYINDGVLSISNNNQLGPVATGAGMYINGGTLQATDNVTLNNAGSNARTITFGGSGGTIDVATGKTLTVSGTLFGFVQTGISNQGYGGLTIDNSDGGNGTLVISGANQFIGGVNINRGVLRMNNAAALGLHGINTLAFGTGTTQTLQTNGFNPSVAALTSTSANAIVENSHASTASIVNVNTGHANTFSGTLRNGGTGTLGLAKGGVGVLTLTGTNTYTGPTTVLGGTLKLGSTGTLAAGSAVTVSAFGTLAGNGTAAGTVTLNAGGHISPGSSAGTLTTGSENWNGGAAYDWELNNATGTSVDAGTNWDLLAVAGTLTIGSTNVNPFAINIISLNGSNAPGATPTFSPAGSYQWLIADANSTIAYDSATDLSKFSLNHTAFDALNGANAGAWSLQRGDEAGVGGDSSQLFVTYNVPEPASVGLLATITGLALGRRRRMA